MNRLKRGDLLSVRTDLEYTNSWMGAPIHDETKRYEQSIVIGPGSSVIFLEKRSRWLFLVVDPESGITGVTAPNHFKKVK